MERLIPFLPSPLAANWKQKGISTVLWSIFFLSIASHITIAAFNTLIAFFLIPCSTLLLILFLSFVPVTQTQKMSVFIFCLCSNVPFSWYLDVFRIGWLLLLLLFFFNCFSYHICPRDGLQYFSIKLSLIQTHFNPLNCLTTQIYPFGFTSLCLAFV